MILGAITQQALECYSHRTLSRVCFLPDLMIFSEHFHLL
jgi:hypothetical protein